MDKKDLMIGDWVKIKTYGISEKFERTIVYQYVKIAEIGSCHITTERSSSSSEPFEICKDADIEPIPLTPEILEKNDIEYQYGMPWYQGGYDEKGFKVHFALHCQVHLHWVHQLQQMLRILGIDKQIIL